MSDGDEMKPMLSIGEVAQLLGIHRNTARRWSDLGIIKAFRISRRGDRRFRYKDISSFLDSFNRQEDGV